MSLVLATYGMVMANPRPVIGQTGVVVIAHGSPSPRWNRAVADAVEKVQEQLAEEPGVGGTRLAYLEAVRPGIADAVSELTADGCRRIVAVPMFIAASGHVLYDIPVVLGVLHDPAVAQTLQEEGITLVSPTVPITLTPPLSEGRCLDAYAVAEAKRLSQDPKREAVLLLLHGDDDFRPKLDRLAQRVIHSVQREVGVSSGDWCYIGTGHHYGSGAVPKIKQAAAEGRRVLVVALFAATSARQLHEGWVQKEAGGNDPFQGPDVAFSDRILTEHPALIDDLLAFARGAVHWERGSNHQPDHPAAADPAEKAETLTQAETAALPEITEKARRTAQAEATEKAQVTAEAGRAAP
ncbi:MAG: hypothetical protein GYA33_15590 [Thermogutta sp.]|nr:hypothetical protein [Thermogutta sp.]